jgi:diaminohydroxyphosphoribosylaminopyrimidine deaminase/5-amino-6-(5-phosphoribosylamino)uracil reductase
MMTSEELMRSALHEARKGTRKVRPNPKVGCCIELASGELISGHHSVYGGIHAERAALEKLKGESAAKARVAVTLEPCSHTGQTPPCVDALIEAKVAEVILPFADPNPLVAGKGIEKLQKAGIRVTSDICKAECFNINREWLWAKVLKRPFVTLKIASSKNAVGASTERRWITSVKARQHAMSLRARVDVLISSGATVRSDDPALTNRDENGNLSPDQPHVMIFSRTQNLGEAKKILQHPHWEWHQSSDLLVSLKSLANEGVFDVMLETGPALSEKFCDDELVDEVWHYEAQIELKGAQYNLDFLRSFNLVEQIKIDEENFFSKYLRKERAERNFPFL